MIDIFKKYKCLLCWEFCIVFTLLFISPLALYFLSTSNFQTHKVMASIGVEHFLKFNLGTAILYYICAILMIHLMFSIVIWWNSCFFSFLFRLKQRQTYLLGTLLSCLAVLWCYLLNANMYPNSQHAVIVDIFSRIGIDNYVLLSISAFFLSVTFLSLFSAANLKTVFADTGKKLKSKRLTSTLTIIIIIFITLTAVGSAVYGHWKAEKSQTEQTDNRPNIILIGIDSLRPDSISINSENTTRMPVLTKFIAEGAIFKTVFTPLARTYPSWSSILTGVYPNKHGARYNLISEEYLNSHIYSLAQIYKEQGYQSIYATDEKRFSNIDTKLGFNKIIGPSIGAADFILGTINDLPLSNLISNTRLGKWLFPFTYSNRAAWPTYRPETFVDLLRDTLPQKNVQPLFLGIHLCLPHWPYSWATQNDESLAVKNSEFYYANALEESDRQFKMIINLLKKRNYLENSIVVVLSDHGENFASDTIEYLDLNKKASPLLRIETYGHGTNVLSRKQHQVVLAFCSFGEIQIQSSQQEQVAGLIDVAPTLLDYSNIKIKANQFDGISLRPWIDNHGQPSEDRYMFVESGFSVPAILSNSPNMMKAFTQGAKNYTILKNGRVVINPESMPLLINEKQYAVYWGPWTYAIIPDGFKKGLKEIFVNHMTNQKNFSNHEAVEHKKTLKTILCKQFESEESLQKNKFCQD